MTGEVGATPEGGVSGALRLLLVRHAEPVTPTVDGPAQPLRPLTPRGRGQALALAAELCAACPHTIVSSPYRRALETVEPTASRLGLARRCGLLARHAGAGRLPAGPGRGGRAVERQRARAAARLGPGATALVAGPAARVRPAVRQPGPRLGGPVMARAMIAWTELFGAISFELFGRLNNLIDQARSACPRAGRDWPPSAARCRRATALISSVISAHSAQTSLRSSIRIESTDLNQSKKAVPGALDAPHSWTSITDVAKTLVTAGLFSPLLKELRATHYQWDRPFVMDSTVTERTFGLAPVELDAALAAVPRPGDQYPA